METTKICSKCNQKKEISDFYIFKHTGKYHKRCKICDGYIEKERYKIMNYFALRIKYAVWYFFVLA